jgi:hypothetical protein
VIQFLIEISSKSFREIRAFLEKAKKMAHRKLDVDALDEDRFLEDDELASAPVGGNDDDAGAPAASSATFSNVNINPPRTPQEIEQDLLRSASAVRNHLSR